MTERIHGIEFDHTRKSAEDAHFQPIFSDLRLDYYHSFLASSQAYQANFEQRHPLIAAVYKRLAITTKHQRNIALYEELITEGEEFLSVVLNMDGQVDLVHSIAEEVLATKETFGTGTEPEPQIDQTTPVRYVDQRLINAE